MKKILALIFTAILFSACTLPAPDQEDPNDDQDQDQNQDDQQQDDDDSSYEEGDVTVDLEANSTIQSPLIVTGQAPGPWYFEGIFSVELLDANNTVIAQGPAEAQSNWMTSSPVPFQIILNFGQPSTSSGMLVLHKANPSGLPANDATIQIPVNF